jgi:peptidoglycan hydrolase-like protein with peptidoglycan-binding domain
MLIQRGYSCGSKGADGKFGDATLKAVKAFQADNVDPTTGKPLKVDGIVGSGTWAAIESTEPTKHYTVTIPGLTLSVAQGLVAQYPNSTMKEE